MEYLEEPKLPLSKRTNGADRTTKKSLIFHLLRKREKYSIQTLKLEQETENEGGRETWPIDMVWSLVTDPKY